MSDTAKKTPLHAAHVAMGGRMVEFAGYDMPVQYQGVIAEAQAVREGAGMFDVSHMARLRFHGEHTLAFLEFLTSNDVAKLEDGRGQYSLLPNASGGVVDDIIVYRLAVNEFRMVVNAANHEKDVAWIRKHLPEGILMEDHTEHTAMIAVQGPKAAEILAGLSDVPSEILEAPMFGVVHGTIAGHPCFAARSGYTGEDGYEVICTADHAEAVWKAFADAGVLPCGLGSRDTLRVEAGLPLYGHELSDDRSPIEAGLGWVIGKEKHFMGCEHIREAQANGTPQTLVGIRLGSKRVASPGMPVFVGEEQVGEVSSGVYSPFLGCGVAFAFVRPGLSVETACTIEIRGKHEEGTLVNKRFFRRKKAA